jgi:hypothetical protein
MDPELARQFGDRPIALDRRQRNLRFEPGVVLLPLPFISCSCAIGAF